MRCARSISADASDGPGKASSGLVDRAHFRAPTGYCRVCTNVRSSLRSLLYSSFNQSSGASFHAAPATAPAVVDAACGFTSTVADLVLPVFLDLQGTLPLVLPLHQVRFDMGGFSGDHNCIGQYNAQGLDPAAGCVADGKHPTFLDGARMSAFFSLEETDKVVISQIGQTLCLILSGNAAAFGNGSSPVNACKRDGNGNIVFAGDWCAATNQAATPECHDAVRFGGNFAASAAKLD